MAIHRRGLIGLAAAAALAVGALTALPATADDPREWVPAGTLTLDPAGGSVAYDGLTQTLATSGTCDLAVSGKNLLSFSGDIAGAAKKPGYRDGALGVQETLTSWCNYVDAYSYKGPESLFVSLGSDMKNFADRPLLSTKATLDLTVKSVWGKAAEVQLTALRGGKSGTVAAAQTVKQGAGGCGAASGSICSVSIESAQGFDTLKLRAAKGAFRIAHPVLIDLISEVDKDLTCDDPTLTQGNASVTYLGSAGQECAGGSAVTLESGDTEVRILKDLSDNPNAEFIVDVTWRLPASAYQRTSTDPDINPVAIPATTIDFETDGDPETEVQFELGVCPDPLYDPESGDFLGVANPLTNADVLDLDSVLDGKQFACSGPSQSEVDGEDLVITEAIYLLGDARMRK